MYIKFTKQSRFALHGEHIALYRMLYKALLKQHAVTSLSIYSVCSLPNSLSLQPIHFPKCIHLPMSQHSNGLGIDCSPRRRAIARYNNNPDFGLWNVAPDLQGPF